MHHDSLGILEKLNDDQAGKLFKAISLYGAKGEIDCDMQTELLLFPFQSQFDRDNEAYQKVVERNKNNGSKGGRPPNPSKAKKPTGLSGISEDPKKADSVNGSDKDKDSGNDNEVIKDIPGETVAPKFNFKKELLSLGVDKQVLDDWLEVRRAKKARNTKTAFDALIKQITESGLSASDAVKCSAEEGWSGFKAEWYRNRRPPAKSTHSFEHQKYKSGAF